MTPLDTITETWTSRSNNDATVTPEFADDSRIAQEQGWRDIIDNYLVEWGSNPSILEEEDFTPPTQEVIRRAVQYALNQINLGEKAPLRIVPDGEGGVCFEWRIDPYFRSVKLLADGTEEWLIFKECILVERMSF